jgi:hypothetical protein
MNRLRLVGRLLRLMGPILLYIVGIALLLYLILK